MPTDHPGRVYACARCQREVLVCSGCDRGQRYCSVACRRQARRECLLVAGRRYQSGRAGRFAHARRACRYRRRQKIVTHQASQVTLGATTVVADSVEAAQVAATSVTAALGNCRWCGGECPPPARRGFLGHGRVSCHVPQWRAAHGQSP